MSSSHDAMSLEAQIEQWRNYLRRRQAIHTVDVAELEDHLREQLSALEEAGLATDEAFLIAVKRLGDLDTLSREFAREHSDRLWKQLVVVSDDAGGEGARTRTDTMVAWGVAIAVGVLVKLGIMLHQTDSFYIRNISFAVLPLLGGYFAWKRRLPTRTIAMLAAGFVAAAFVMNGYPFHPMGSTEVLAALHLPVAAWLGVGIAYAGGRWHDSSGRMDFVRFSGELVIYYALIALGGAVITGFTAMIFQVIGFDIEPFMEEWFPCLVLGAVPVAAWLVEAKQSVIENMAPVLTRLFTPLVILVLLAFLGTLLWTGRGIAIERDALLAFDVLLLLVLALVLYSLSARDPEAPTDSFDILRVVLLWCALAADAVALWAIGARITEFGFTPNRVAVLGINLILLVNLAASAVLHGRFLRGRTPFATLIRWQTGYLPVYAAWAAIVVIVFPLLFGFI